MDPLREIYQRLLREVVPSYYRQFYKDFRLDLRIVGVVGSRGVGKTTFLLNYLRENYGNSPQGLYVSADNLYFVEHTLLEVVDRFVKEYDGKLICIDEIHKYKNWNQELKNIWDSYPTLHVIFSGSSSIDLVKAKYDLSRRAFLKTMYGFSFREYLEVKTGATYPVLSFSEIITNHGTYERELSGVPRLLGYFKDYLKEGYYPTRLELGSYDAYIQSLQNIVDKTIYEDISSFYSLYTSNLDSLEKIIYYFATSQPGGINVNKLAGNLKKDFTTIADYIQMLRDTGLLRFLLTNKHGHALVRNAEKVYLDNPNLLYALNAEVGQEPLVGVVRELFILSNLQNSNNHVFYSQVADFECQGVTLEVGGKHKTSAAMQAMDNAYIVQEDILLGDAKHIPLYLFGFLY